MTAPLRPLVQQIFAPRCPRCGKGKLFKDMLGIVDACAECQLVLKHHDAADGPTFFAIVIVGFLVMALMSVVEFNYAPPLWVHALLWIPFTCVACVLCLRTVKTILITVEYQLALLREKDPHA